MLYTSNRRSLTSNLTLLLSTLPRSSNLGSIVHQSLHAINKKKLSLGGRLEDALAQYKRSNDFGVDRAAMHIRNVNISPLPLLFFCFVQVPLN